MEINYDTKIDNIQRMIKIKHLQELVKKLKSDESDYHINDLNIIIKILKDRNNEISDQKIEVKESRRTKGTDNLFNKMDQYMFNKPWNRLPEIHKLIKIKEYVNNSLIIYETQKKEKLIKVMFNHVKQKNLTKKGSVNYDQVNSRIVSIPSLKYNKKKEEYYLNL